MPFIESMAPLSRAITRGISQFSCYSNKLVLRSSRNSSSLLVKRSYVSSRVSPKKPQHNSDTTSSAQKVANKTHTSSVLPGTILKGLCIKAGGVDPVAREDHEYPEWLWSLLDEPAPNSKTARSHARKSAIRAANFLTKK
ncbi:54S ribosomal protein L37, mitochondrial [Schizosaccharomyces pombe]